MTERDWKSGSFLAWLHTLYNARMVTTGIARYGLANEQQAGERESSVHFSFPTYICVCASFSLLLNWIRDEGKKQQEREKEGDYFQQNGTWRSQRVHAHAIHQLRREPEWDLLTSNWAAHFTHSLFLSLPSIYIFIFFSTVNCLCLTVFYSIILNGKNWCCWCVC